MVQIPCLWLLAAAMPMHKSHSVVLCCVLFKGTWPTARLLSKMYENREPTKICQMRVNTFAQILTAVNIHQGCNVVVVENCSGVLLSLIMERLGGAGSVINMHTGETPTNLHAVSHMNFPESYWSTLHSLPLCHIGPLLADRDFATTVGAADFDIIGDTKDLEKPLTNSNVQEGVKDKSKKRGELTEEEKCRIRTERRRKRLHHQRCAWETLHGKNIDAVIIACRFHPSPILLSLLEFLAPSRPFVVYNESQEPLMELFCQLMDVGKAVNLKISETFTRSYQVLPEQTHPLVTMNTTGGFLLTGIKVDTFDSTRKKLHNIQENDEAPSKKTKLR